jgi:hypothetical protein
MVRIFAVSHPSPTEGTRKTETPANDRGRLPYLYFQCIEVGRVKWHISEECFCRGSKLKPARVFALRLDDANSDDVQLQPGTLRFMALPQAFA